jgi:hypothetical protein
MGNPNKNPGNPKKNLRKPITKNRQNPNIKTAKFKLKFGKPKHKIGEIQKIKKKLFVWICRF